MFEQRGPGRPAVASCSPPDAWPARPFGGAAVIMSDQEKWVSLPQAVAIVKAAAGLSQGSAQRTLIAICESGDVRTRWTGHYSKTYPPIHKRDWIGADIDWANFRVVKADGAGMAGVDFSEDDLRGWAAQRLATKPDVAQTTPRLTAEEAAVSLITTWLKEDSGLTRATVSVKAHQAIRDLQPKEFDRAWRGVPQELKKGPGRPGKNPLENPPF
jgi:hypothetical protein